MLSLIFSLLVRHLLPTVPVHGVTAPDPGSGKTKIVEAAAGATTGRDVARMNYRNLEEFEKQLPLPLMGGDPLVLIDNVGTRITSHMLSTVVTADGEFVVRKLGETKEIRTVNCSVFAPTGNHLDIGGDLPRRVVMATITPNTENPESRKFDFNPPVRARAMFPELAMAGLTALRWHLQAGCPLPDQDALGNFEEWIRIVRGLLVTLGIGDPLLTQQKVRADNMDATSDTQLLLALRADFGDAEFTVSQINKRPEPNSPKRCASLSLLLTREGRWNPTHVGKSLGKLVDKVRDGLQLQKLGVEHNATLWKVAEVISETNSLRRNLS